MGLMLAAGRCRVFAPIRAHPWHHKQCLHSSQAYNNFVLV